MLQAPTGFMRQWPKATLMPTSVLLPQGAPSDDLLLSILSMEEAHFEDRLREIGKINNHLVVIGKPKLDSKEDPDADVEEDDADNIDESDAEEFEQETG